MLQAVPRPFLLCFMSNEGELVQNCCGWMHAYPSCRQPTGSKHSLDLLSVTTPLTSVVRRKYPVILYRPVSSIFLTLCGTVGSAFGRCEEGGTAVTGGSGDAAAELPHAERDANHDTWPHRMLSRQTRRPHRLLGSSSRLTIALTLKQR